MATISLTLTRCSVCAGDDCDAPHTKRIEISELMPLKFVIADIISSGYLPRIEGGRATWLIEMLKPVGIVAQQWPNPRYWVDEERPVQSFIGPKSQIHFRYEVQKDPEAIFAEYKSHPH